MLLSVWTYSVPTAAPSPTLRTGAGHYVWGAIPMPAERVEFVCRSITRSLTFDDFPAVAHLCGLAEHDRGRTVLFRREFDGPLHRVGVESFAGDNEMQSDARKHFWVGFRPLGRQFHFATRNFVAPL